MKNKRIAALGLAMIMAIGTMLTGCGQKENETTGNQKNSETQENSEASEAASEEEVQLEEKTIQFWMAGPGKQKDAEKVWEAFNEKLQEYVPNTTVEFSIMTGSEYKEKYSQMMASGEAVDLAWEAGWVTGRTQDQEAADGNILALDELLDEYGQGIKEALGEDVLDMHRYSDGKLYYIPSWQGLFTGKHGYRVPTELAELAGDTWVEDTQAAVTKWYNEEYSAENYQAVFDQFDKYFAAAQAADKLYSGVDPETCFAGFYFERRLTECIPIKQSVGVVVNDNTFTVTDAIQSEHYRIMAENMADFYKKGYFRSDIASWDRNSVSFVTNGEYTPNTVILSLHNLLTEGYKNTYESEAGVDLSFITVEEQGRLGKGTSTSVVIPYCADEPERAMMVYNAIYSVPELYQLLVYGIEGEHYTDNGDGTITTPYGGQGTEDSDYGIWKWGVGTCLNALPSQVDDPTYYTELAEQEKTAYINPFISFVFDESEVSDVIAALKAVDEEYTYMIVRGYTGDDWETTLNKWIDERKAAGVDKLIEEYQTQLDAYIEANGITSW